MSDERWQVHMPDVIAWISRHCRVQSAKPGRKSVPMVHKPRQERLLLESPSLSLQGGTDVSCKTRQVGETTELLCVTLALATMYPGATIVWMAPEKILPKLRAKFRIIRASVERSRGSGWPGCEIDNAEEITLTNGSRIQWTDCGSTKATAQDAGISDTAHLAILSETCIWPQLEVSLRALEPSLAHSGCSLFMDSTPPVESGKGQAYIDICKAAWKGTSTDRLHLWYWWEEPAYTADKPAPGPYSTDEQGLINRGVTLFQIQWRRQMLASPKWTLEKFRRAYIESAATALRPFGNLAFDDALIEQLEATRENEGFPEYRTGADLLHLVPYAQEHPRDPFYMPGVVRIWEAPIPGEKYRAGVDAAQGEHAGDWQAKSIVDSEGEHVATVLARVDPLVLASMVQRLGLWYNTADVHVELEKFGTLVHDHLKSLVDPREADARGAHSCVCERYPKKHLHGRKVNANTKSARIAATYAWLPITEVKDPDILDEMLTLDDKTGEKRDPYTDTDDYLDSLGIARDELTKSRKRAPKRAGVVVGRRR